MFKGKSAVIDVGSNSVRLMMSESGQTLYKQVIITRLAEGYSEKGLLTQDAMDRTVIAISQLVEKASLEKADKLFIFATAAVRNSKNKNEFIEKVYNACGIKVEVISGQLEAQLGYVGALNGKDGGVIDIGGASTEITVRNGDNTSYSKSVYVGVVSLRNACGQDEKLLEEFINEKIVQYGKIPKTQFYGIGGTVTSVASVMQGLEVYDANKVNGYVIFLEQLKELKNRVFAMSERERENIVGLQKGRANVFAGGILLLIKLMQKLGVDKIIVSERDNLEGYLTLKENIGE